MADPPHSADCSPKSPNGKQPDVAALNLTTNRCFRTPERDRGALRVSGSVHRTGPVYALPGSASKDGGGFGLLEPSTADFGHMVDAFGSGWGEALTGKLIGWARE